MISVNISTLKLIQGQKKKIGAKKEDLRWPMARSLTMMRCVSASDGLPHIARLADTNSGPLRFRISTVISFGNVINSTRNYHTLCKNRTEKHFDLYSVMRVILSRFSVDTANLSRLYPLTSCSLCRKAITQSVYINKKTVHRNISGSYINTAASKDDKPDSDSDSDDHIRPALDSVIPSIPAPTHVDIVPGKGPPPEPPVDCCMSGCANCVWIQYAEELKQYYSLEKGGEKAKEAIEQIENPGLQMFLKLELGLL